MGWTHLEKAVGTLLTGSYLAAMRGSSGSVRSGSAPSVPSTWLGLGFGFGFGFG